MQQCATCVSDFNGAIKKCRNWQNYSAVPVTFIYSCRQYGHHKQKKKLYFKFHDDIEHIWININIISFSFLYGFLRTKYFNEIEKKNFSQEEGGCLIMAMSIDSCCGGHFFLWNRAFLSRTGLFCLEPCILLSNWAFLCRMSLIIFVILNKLLNKQSGCL